MTIRLLDTAAKTDKEGEEELSVVPPIYIPRG
jgi:hypothetical protein